MRRPRPTGLRLSLDAVRTAPRRVPRGRKAARAVVGRAVVGLALCALLGAGCASAREQRAEVIRIDGQWRLGEMEEDSFARMVEAVRGLGQQSTDDGARMAAVPDLLRLVLKDPASFVRAEALRSAWLLGGALPVEPFREDELERAEFNRRTERLEVLVADEQTVNGEETIELAVWLASFHAPSEAPEIAVSVSEVVLSQALYRPDDLGQAFHVGMDSSLSHALVLVTLHAASDPYPVVREQALASAWHLHPEIALALVAGVLARENDSTVVLAALDSLGVLRPGLPAQDLADAVAPLAASTNVAVKRRIRDLMALPGS